MEGFNKCSKAGSFPLVLLGELRLAHVHPVNLKRVSVICNVSSSIPLRTKQSAEFICSILC